MGINKNGIVESNSLTNSIINNFSQSGTTDGWQLGGSLSSDGSISITSTAPQITSPSFTVGSDDILQVDFNVNMTSLSSSGDGLYFGIERNADTIVYAYDYSTGTWDSGTDNSSSPWNAYFIRAFQISEDYRFKTYILGSNITISDNLIPYSTNNYAIWAIKLKTECETFLHARYNTNTEMTLKFWDPSVCKCNLSKQAQIYNYQISANNFIEI